MSPQRSFKVKNYFKIEDKDEIREMMIASADYSHVIALADDVLDFKSLKLPSAAAPGPRKRAKLDNLSPDEKIRRKKLKNREAAQTSRDKKRLYVNNLEAAVRMMKEENERLRGQVNTLAAKNLELVEKNHKLEMELQQAKTVRGVDAEPRPAAPVVDPRQKDNTRLTSTHRRVALLSLPLLLMATFPTTFKWTWTTWTGSTRSTRAISKNWKGSPTRCLERLSFLRRDRVKRAWWGPRQRNWNPLGSRRSPVSLTIPTLTLSTSTTVI